MNKNIKDINNYPEVKELAKELKIGDPVYFKDKAGVNCVLVGASDYQRMLQALRVLNVL